MSLRFDVSDLYRSYEVDFQRLLKEVNDSLNALANAPKSYDVSAEVLSKTSYKLSEADKCYRQMESELLSYPQNIKVTLLPKLKAYKKSYDDAQKQLKSLERENVRVAEPANEGKYSETRRRILKNGESLIRGVDALEEAQRTATETESLTLSIQAELYGNREIIERARSRTKETSSDLDRSDGILRVLRRKDLTNKLLLLLVIVVLFILDVVILLHKLHILF
eukprot:TRINITY_DN5358_c0_g1_i2.p1 TRINITY_DN5358_c0_g1~~TRINITY_DN5358_c0_g1_i2.p1  ORF type:complete len:223 (+),score=36.95 TRINITY_DN5358_c0_g1_i2:892-1560(+)